MGRPEGAYSADSQRSVLDRADTILAAFDAEHLDLSLLGIMVRTGLPKTTVHRAAHKMVDIGWLDLRDGRYRIGSRILEFVGRSWTHAVLREVALPAMEHLRMRTGETVHLAISDGPDVVYVEKLTGRAPIRDLTRVGARLPSHCTGLGKVLLAFAEPTTESARPADMLSRTPHTIVSTRTMTSELARVQDEGVAYDRQEYRLGVECVAAPLRAAHGGCAGAISITVNSYERQVRHLEPILRAAAAEISNSLPAGTAR